MKVSSYVILALWVTSSPVAAFTPQFSDTRSATQTRIFAEQEQASEVGGTLAATDTTSAAPETATEAAAGAGVSASKAVPFLAPIAALAAGRQALAKRDIVKEQVAITEKDLQRIRKDLSNVDTTISVRIHTCSLNDQHWWMPFDLVLMLNFSFTMSSAFITNVSSLSFLII